MYYTKRGLQAVCIWVLCDPAGTKFVFQKALKKNTNQRATRETPVCDVMMFRLEVRWPKLDKHLNNSKNVPHSLPITSANEAVFMLTISSIFCEKDGSPTHEYLRCQTCQLSRQNIYSYRNATLYGGSGHDCSRMRRCSVLEMANSAGLWIC